MTSASPAAPRRLAALACWSARCCSVDAGPDIGARTYTLDLGVRADFVAQTNFVQCVGASMQMMLNMIEPGRDRSAKTQLRLQKLARGWSGPRPDGTQRQGASVSGLGGGPQHPGRRALQARRVEDARGRAPHRGEGDAHHWPAGRPAHLARPARLGHERLRGHRRPVLTDDFRVTSANVDDPLYPYGSRVWGPSPRPGEALTAQAARPPVRAASHAIDLELPAMGGEPRGQVRHGRAVRGRAPGPRGQRVRPGPPVGPDSASRPGSYAGVPAGWAAR